MKYEIWKVLIAVGTVMLLLGPELIKESKAVEQNGNKFYDMHVVMNPILHWIGRISLLFGTVLQILGLYLS